VVCSPVGLPQWLLDRWCTWWCPSQRSHRSLTPGCPATAAEVPTKPPKDQSGLGHRLHVPGPNAPPSDQDCAIGPHKQAWAFMFKQMTMTHPYKDLHSNNFLKGCTRKGCFACISPRRVAQIGLVAARMVLSNAKLMYGCDHLLMHDCTGRCKQGHTY